jgi:hypothetical protein
MRKFTNDDDFSYLKDCTLTRISVDRYQVVLLFAEGYQILMEHGLEYLRANGGETFRYDIQAGCGAVHFHEPLEQKVAKVSADETSIELRFEDGAIIRVLTDDGPHESGLITGPGVNHYAF